MKDDRDCNISEGELIAMISCDGDAMTATTRGPQQRENPALPIKTTSVSFPCMNYSNRTARSRKTRFNYIIMAVLVVGVFVRPIRYVRQSSLASNIALKPLPPLTPLFANEKPNHVRQESQRPDDAHDHDNSVISSQIMEIAMSSERDSSNSSMPKTQQVESFELSKAPLFYHVSPGSTGSRTFYHAACASGFPSVHHKSFCISRTRGIRGVHENVVRGVRSHFQLLRLYEMAAECSSLWAKGKLDGEEEDAVLSNSNDTATSAQQLCYTPLRQWSNSVQSHLTAVLRSGLVGLFDTPYPYLATQLLDLTKEYRAAPPVIAVTERDPHGWATSRIKHGILTCREEYSLDGLGASEFDVVGCVERAHGTSDSGAESKALHFWDAFRWRSVKEAVNETFQIGMERQMGRHQEVYVPVAQYAPDIFGVRSSASPKSESKPIEEKDVVRDIRHHILDGRGSNDNNDVELLQSLWQGSYTTSLTCRGRVSWERRNDTLVEYYHVPRTCEDMPSNKKTRKKIDGSNASMIPLIPV